MGPCSQAPRRCDDGRATPVPLPSALVSADSAWCRRARLPRRIRLGRGHGGAPDRGRQREQRLVGVGAHPGSGTAEPSGDACDSWHRWREDVALVADMGLGAYRFSLEWSRIEPERGGVPCAALDHYRRICAACRGRGILPVVTFHHFTTPRWLAGRGGLGGPRRPGSLRPLRHRAAAHLGDLIGWACTINEPNVVAVMGYFQGEYPPGVKEDFVRYGAVNGPWCGPIAWPSTRCGPVRATSRSGSRCPWPRWWPTRGARRSATVPRRCSRTSSCAPPRGRLRRRPVLHPDALRCRRAGRRHPAVPVTQMGDERWPQAVEPTVRRAAAVSGRPVVVTENGIATEDDAERDRLPDRRPAQCAPLPGRRASTCGATSPGACSTTSSGTWATGRSSAWWPWTGPPSSGGPSPVRTGSGRWPGPTGCSQPLGWLTARNCRWAGRALARGPCRHGTGLARARPARVRSWSHTGRRTSRSWRLRQMIAHPSSVKLFQLRRGVGDLDRRVQLTLFLAYGVLQLMVRGAGEHRGQRRGHRPLLLRSTGAGSGARGGKSHFWREVMPFWVMSFLGLAISSVGRLGRRPSPATTT